MSEEEILHLMTVLQNLIVILSEAFFSYTISNIIPLEGKKT